MQSNQTVVFPEPETVTVTERPVPEVGPTEVLVEASRSLVSTGTELTHLRGDFPEGSVWDEVTDYPIEEIGYCTVGTVVETGADVDEFDPDQRVAAWAPHARYSAVDAADVFPVPDGPGDDEAAFFAIAQIVLNGVRRGRVDLGEAVASTVSVCSASSPSGSAGSPVPSGCSDSTSVTPGSPFSRTTRQSSAPIRPTGTAPSWSAPRPGSASPTWSSR